jgi:inhibitor of KinA
MAGLNPYRIFPLGDSAITLDFGNVIDQTINQKIITLFQSFSQEPLPGMIEVVPAYSSLTVYYDVFQLRKLIPANKIVYEWVTGQLEKRIKAFVPENNLSPGFVKIPVCYEKEFAPDMEEIAIIKKLSVEDVIRIHTSKMYRVYMLGFLPGFAYMGEVDAAIKISRRSQPRQYVEAGSVGIAGSQTGIYPLASPGGWQIIGRTPLKLFEASPIPPSAGPEKRTFEDSICLLHPGDIVQFYSISKEEFEKPHPNPSPGGEGLSKTRIVW